MRSMTLQPITYRGRMAAAATRSRFFLADDLDRRAAEDPERTFVIYMCAYAGDILNQRLPGPYSQDDACAYARACLIPAELVERDPLDTERAARALCVPENELIAARAGRPCVQTRSTLGPR